MLSYYHSRNLLYTIRDQPDLIKAIIRNDLQKIRLILQASNFQDLAMITDQSRRTPLHLAASLGRTEILRCLIETDYISVNCRDNGLVTPLHRACRNNHLDCVRLLIQSKANVNARTRHHLTPLHICASVGALECAQVIIEHGTNIDATDLFGATALHHAIYNSKQNENRLDIIKLLIKRGAKADVQDKFGQRPIHYAAVVDDPSIIQILVNEANVDVNVKNKHLLTPLHMAVTYNSKNAFSELLLLNANLEAQDIHGNNILHWVAYLGDMPIFEIVMKRMKMNSLNLNGMTPLHYACLAPLSFSIVVELLKHYGSNLDIFDKFNRTPLHYAAMNGLSQVVQLLISNGSDYNICDCELEAPIHKAVRNVHPKVIDLLIEHQANVNVANRDGFTPLHLAVTASNGQLCKVLINAGANPLQWDSCGRTAHFLAVYMGSIECFFTIMSSPIYKDLMDEAERLKTEPKPFFPLFDAFKRSLLHYAAASRCTEEFIQIILLKKDFKKYAPLDERVAEKLGEFFSCCDLNKQDIFGRTPLHYLCRRSNEIEVDITSLVQLFIKCGADCSILDNNNRFPFHYAVANGYTSTLRYLIDPQWFQNHNIYQQTFRSVSCPLKIAAFYGHCAVLKELLKLGFNDYEGAFEIAIRKNHWDCARHLMNFIRNKKLLLKMACFTAFFGLEGLQIFLNVKMPSFWKKLLFVASISKKGTSCVQLLLLKGANVQARDCHGRNALFYSVATGNNATIRLLLHSGIRIVKDHTNRNVFHLIAHKGDLPTFEFLCTYSRPKNFGYYETLCNCLLSKDDEGYSPIEIACINQHQNILEFFLKNVSDNYTQKLMFFSGIAANTKFMYYTLYNKSYTFFLSRGPNGRTLLHYYCMSKNMEILVLEYLINLKFDVNLADEKGLTPLLCAANAGNTKAVEYLLEHTQVNIMVVDKEGNTILHLACMSGSSRTAMVVIEYAKKHNLIENFLLAKNNSKQTCLHLAAKMSLPSVIQELLRSGASINDEDTNGYTPSLYCTRDLLAAYCLVIIESYMETEIPSFSNNSEYSNQTIDRHSSEILDGSKNNESSINTKQIVNGRISLPASLDSNQLFQLRLEQRIRRMSSIVCDKLSQLSLNQKPNTNHSSDELVNENNSSLTVDSDTELY